MDQSRKDGPEARFGSGSKGASGVSSYDGFQLVAIIYSLRRKK